MGRQTSDQLSAAEKFSVIPPAGAHRSSLRRPPCDGGRPLGRNARRAPGTSRRFLYTSQAGAPPAVVLQCSLLPLSAFQARTGVFSSVTGHRPLPERHRIFLLLHRTSGGCAQDSPRIHPAVMPHPARGAGHPQRAVNHPAGGPRRRPFLWIDAWTPPQPEFETTQCTPWSHPWGSYPRSSNTKPPSAPAWAVSRQTSFRRRETFLLFPRPAPNARA